MPALSPFRRLFFLLLFLVAGSAGFGQQLQWAKVYPLVKRDAVYSIAQDSTGCLYVGGSTARNPYISFNGTPYDKATITKLYSDGDTAFVKDLGIAGNVLSLVVDSYGLIFANVRQNHINAQFQYHTYYVWMSTDGFIIRMDSIQNAFSPNSCILAQDSSIITVGLMFSPVNPGYRSMYLQRITKDWVIEPVIELNPGHPNCVANRVEQLPNGHYLVSGYVGSRIASYELDEWGMNPVFKQWYQTPDFSNMSSGHVSRINGQRYMIGGQGNPSRVGIVDSLGQRIWLRNDNGNQIPPQAMTDGSVVFGYRSGQPPYQTFFRMAMDSSYVWNMALLDSLIPRGIYGNIDLTCFTYFEDQSAVVAGRFNDGSGNTDDDPIFLRIANVGTPVTSLTKPKKGPLQNETLAPWPNPSDGTLYLKQHFDIADIHLYQLSGQEVAQYQIRFGQPIQIHQLPAGLYLYRAVIDGKAFSGKIVKAAP